jgi:hypothetical protein
MAQGNERQEDGDFLVSVKWPPPSELGPERVLDASVGALSIAVKDKVATAYKRDRGDVGTDITIPLYDVAGWIAENWWALLFEPKKVDRQEEDADFRARHWLGAARHGFALPDLWFLPEGNRIELSAKSAYLRFARLTFTEDVSESVPLEAVQRGLSNFVEHVLSHLKSSGINDTEAQKAWNLVRGTSADEQQYCRLIGSLGLSPYDEHADIDQLLNGLSERLNESILVDLFEASDLTNLSRASVLTEKIYDALPHASEISIAPLSELEMPEDRSSQAWRRGVEATNQVRTHFGISNLDPRGGDEFFQKLGLNPGDAPMVSDDEGIASQVSAAFDRRSDSIRLALAGESEPHKRFAAARAAFLAWDAQRDASRLVTRARTREQQASRAFAAEMLAPIGFIRRRGGGQGALSSSRVEEIARELQVSAQVVQYQAQNNRIAIW